MVKKLCIIVILALSSVAARGIDTGNAIFNERIRTLQVHTADSEYALPGAPMMVLGSGDGITVEFDHLADDREYLRYELIHCNADWQPSQLSYIEYLDGFNEGIIDDYAFSQATTVHYVHYQFTLPNDQMMPLVSGNYLVRVYPEGNPDQKWLQCRFVVSEQTAVMSAELTSRTDIDYNRAHQQLSLALNVEHSNVRDVFNDLTIVVEQNGRTDNRVTLTHPIRVSGTTLYYEHQPELIFKAGNEYRRFEDVSHTYPGMHIDRTEWIAPYYHTVLEADESRPGESYHYDETLSGGFVVREYNADDSDTQADYNVVHFTLNYPETPGFNFYIDGDFVQRRFSPESLMLFNQGTQRYERAMLLKQGAYSYQYLAVAPGSDRGRTDVIEGDKYETRNIYNVYVYNHRLGERYDRLIYVGTLQN
jgi:hypothetical protein